jgi:hypothetical protein
VNTADDTHRRKIFGRSLVPKMGERKVMKTTDKTPSLATSALVDEYGLLSAEIAEREIKLDALKDKIALLGAGAHEGRFYRATVSECSRKTLSIKAATAKLKALGVAARWFRDHTTTTEYTVVKCTARTGHNLRAAA